MILKDSFKLSGFEPTEISGNELTSFLYRAKKIIYAELKDLLRGYSSESKEHPLLVYHVMHTPVHTQMPSWYKAQSFIAQKAIEPPFTTSPFDEVVDVIDTQINIIEQGRTDLTVTPYEVSCRVRSVMLKIK